MNFFKSYITALTVYVFIFSIIQNLLPESKIKKSVSFVFGILLAAAVISPILKLNADSMDIFFGFNEYTLHEYNIEDIEKKQTEQTKSMVEKAVSEGVCKILQKHGLIGKSEVYLSENYNVEKVVTEELCPKAADEIAAFLGISKDRIESRR